MAAFALVGALVVAPSAQAAFSSVYGGTIPCTAQPLNGNIRACSGFTETWDGTKIDVNVFLPPEAGGTEGPYPTIGDFHGWGGSKQGLTTVEPAPGLTFQQKDPRIQHWAEEGYAVFSMSDRGWGLSCGKYDPQIAEAVCEQGYNHLMDDRYEVRDAQFLISELADEGVAAPKKVGATGASYGGGISVALAALRNREMLPGGELVPWTSPEGKEMELAAAVPQWAWTDIAYALAPNGRNLDYVTNSSYRGPLGKNPIGVMKYSYTEALYIGGEKLSNYSTTNPEADIPGWRERLRGGDPYSDAGVNAMIEQLTAFHSAFYIEHSEAPSPMLLQSGWNDDLFPPDEALRMYQRTRAEYPGDPISLFFADYGHSRSQNKAADVALFNERLEAWFAHYLKGEGAAPSSSVAALTTTCPKSAPSEGPYAAANWSSLAPGEVRFQTSGAQTIGHRSAAEEATPTTTGVIFDPIVGAEKGFTVCSAVPDAEQPGSVNYRLAPAPAGGFTLMGSPTIIAKVESPSPNSEIAARLVDVSPEGTETLIARGLYRPTGGSQEMVFQLHPQGYHFAAGHVAKLELLPSDLPYGRFSNLQANVTVSDLELRLPVMDQPGSLDGLVQVPAPKVVPAGYQLAAEYEEKPTGGGGGETPSPKPVETPKKIGAGGLHGKLTADRKDLIVPLHCEGEGPCSGKVSVTVKRPNGKGSTAFARGDYSLAVGASTKVRVPLTKAGREIVKGQLEIQGRRSKTLSGVLKLNDSGRSGGLTLNRPVHLRGGS
ncbi:MAG: acetylxylan esterase [Actinobacteria bacterium]|nr:acetylxylan esterase [Actinomycetota bacterium]